MKKSINGRLKNHEYLVGTWSDGDNVTDLEIFGLSGYDYVIIDNEHGGAVNPNWLELIRTCENADIVPIVRVPGFTYEDAMKKVLDAGAGGIVVPNVTCKADVETAIRYSKYAPIGNRGACPYKRSNLYSTKWNKIEYYEQANKETTVLLLIETPEAVENFEEIISVEGVDGVLFGRDDLTVAMGIHGQYEHPDLLAAMNKCIEIGTKKNMPMGIVCYSKEDAVQWLSPNVNIVSLGTGRGQMIRNTQEVIRQIKESRCPESVQAL